VAFSIKDLNIKKICHYAMECAINNEDLKDNCMKVLITR
jgi:hypothetical protein